MVTAECQTKHGDSNKPDIVPTSSKVLWTVPNQRLSPTCAAEGRTCAQGFLTWLTPGSTSCCGTSPPNPEQNPHFHRSVLPPLLIGEYTGKMQGRGSQESIM